MWLGYDKPLPERPPITPQKKKKHIKRRTSLILLGLFFSLIVGVPMLTHWYPSFLWGAKIILQDYLGFYSIFIMVCFFCGVNSLGFSLVFKFVLSHDPSSVKRFQELDQNLIRIIPFLIWQEYWDEVYGDLE
jgi:phosphoglycerol transferase MdoB-like AlkP superfamily enzyme